MTHRLNKRPRSTDPRPEPHDIESRDALSWPSANTWEHDFAPRQHCPPLPTLANLAPTDAAGLSASGHGKTVSSEKQ